MNWYFKVLKNYGVFIGRASRKEFWFFFLINSVISMLLIFVDYGLGTIDEGAQLGWISGFYVLATALPTFAVGVRRLHDSGRSGWWLAIGLVPVVGNLVLLVLFLLESNPGENQFGHYPESEPTSMLKL